MKRHCTLINGLLNNDDMKTKLAFAALFTCIAFLPQLQRYHAVLFAHSLPGRPQEIGVYKPSTIWVTMDRDVIVIDTATYRIYGMTRIGDTAQEYACVSPLRKACKVVVSVSRESWHYNAQLSITWRDSINIYKLIKE